MSSALETDRPVTATDLLDLPDDGYRYELVRGCLVRDQAPGFEHATIAANVSYHLKSWSRKTKAGYVAGEGGYKLESNPDTVRAPDVAFVSYERLPAGKPTGFVDGPPDLAVEIVSPSDRLSAVFDKVRDYFDAGVGQVWVVVPQNRTVMVYHTLQDVTVLNDADTLIGVGALNGLELPVAEVFE